VLQNTSRSVCATLRLDAPSAGSQPEMIPMKKEMKTPDQIASVTMKPVSGRAAPAETR
jgi:hypothetical protein